MLSSRKREREWTINVNQSNLLESEEEREEEGRKGGREWDKTTNEMKEWEENEIIITVLDY